MTAFYQRDYAYVLQACGPPAVAKGPEQALHALRCGSACLSSADYANAREYLVLASAIMEDFKVDGEFMAQIGSESAKDYRGDPYEKMYAFFYLGLLDYAFGDHDKALASFKTAALADGGTKDERYKSDSLAVFLMEALSALHLEEKEYAAAAYDQAEHVEAFKYAVDCAEAALTGAREELIREEGEGLFQGGVRTLIQAATGMVHARLSAAAMETQEPAEVLRIAGGDLLTSIESAEGQKDPKLRTATPYVRKVYVRATERLAAVVQERTKQAESARKSAAFVQSLRKTTPNLVVFVETGKAPYKYRRGAYGEQVGIGQQLSEVADCSVLVDEKEVPTELVEDIYFQASTRGARKMDEINAARAAVKTVLGVLAVVDPFGGAFVLFLLTTPKADARHWDVLPERLYLAPVSVRAGECSVEVRYHARDGRVLPGRTQRLDHLKIASSAEFVGEFWLG